MNDRHCGANGSNLFNEMREIMESRNNRLKRRNSLLLALAALIWGIAFVAQSTGGAAVGPYTFNCIRSVIGGIVLFPVIRLSDRLRWSRKKPVSREDRRILFIGGAACGIALSVASNLQQVAIYLGAPVGKAGFLTACYMLIVPVLGLFLKKKCGWNIWIGIVTALIGLYLLCIQGSFSILFSDILLILCALSFAVQILVIDHYAGMVDGVRMACIEFTVCGIISAIPMIFVDMGHSVSGILEWASAFADPYAWIPILYAGALSCGVAYTLQIIGQRGLNPTVASLIMSLESVFSVLAGWVFLGEELSGREISGCALIFGAVLLAQLPMPANAERKTHLS